MTSRIRSIYADLLQQNLDLASDIRLDFGLNPPPCIVDMRQRALNRAAELSRKVAEIEEGK